MDFSIFQYFDLFDEALSQLDDASTQLDDASKNAIMAPMACHTAEIQ